MSRRITPAQYHDMASKRAFKWLGPEVRTTGIKTWWQCSEGHKWQIDYGHIKEGKGCPHCAGNRPRTVEHYHALANERGFEWIGETLVNVMTKTWWHCSRGHEWEAKYNHIKNGRGCPYCSGKAKKTADDFHELARVKGFTWLGDETPQNTITKTRWRCDVGHEFDTNYTVLRVSKGKGCPHCSGKAHKTPESYHELASRIDSQWIGDQMPPTVFGKSQWLCNNKNHEWSAPYHYLDYDHGCPHCSLLETQSKGEKRIVQFLTSLNINFQRQKAFDKCKDKNVLRFDFYFMFAGQPFLIEYNGQQHYHAVGHWGGEEALKTSKRRDRIKADFAQANGLHLIIIPYSDFDKIGTIIINELAEWTGFNPLDYPEPVRERREEVEPLEGFQLSLDLG